MSGTGETLVFVYGTLRRGEENHGLLGRARFVREARTAPAYDLLDLGGFPGAVEGGGTPVVGEVYAVDRMTLVLLDELEDHPETYCRTVAVLEDGTPVEIYLLPKHRASCFPRIASGNWKTRLAG